MNSYQALKVLNIKSNPTQDEIKASYRKLALELHPDKNKDKNEDVEFKKITEAYTFLKKNYNQNNNLAHQEDTQRKSNTETNFKRKPKWTSPAGEKIPEQDWSKYTREFEDGDPEFWKEYESKFWKEYNARIRPDGRNGEFDKAKEPDKQPNLFVDVDKSLCIGCCSCETIAPGVFEINKQTRSNPKSSVINQKGAGINKIMNAAQTCPTKAIKVENLNTKEILFPY